MGDPVLLVIDDDADGLGAIERELRDRYERHYRIICVRSPDEARSALDELAASGEDVALVLAAERLGDTTGGELLGEAGHIRPHARRALLIGFQNLGQRDFGDEIFRGIAHGRFDQYIVRPSTAPDEEFHQTISTMLLEWAEARRAAPYTIHVVGETWSGRAYELREALQQCAVPHSFCLLDSDEGRALVASARDGAQLPLMVLPNGEVLENPDNAQIAVATGGPVNPGSRAFDVVVVGAGPSGLSAAVYAASEGLATLVVDSGGIGGQATSSSLIRNYLGFPRGISGRRLARAAYEQAWVFGADFVFMHTITGVERDGDELVVSLSDSDPVRTTAVLLAMGARYRRIEIPELEALNGAGVYYGGPTSEAPGLVGEDTYIVGGANSAGQAALHLARYAREVTLVIRASSLRAGMSDYLVRQIEATDNIEVRLGTEVVGGGGNGRLEHLVLRDLATQAETTVEAQALFLLIGAQPHTDWLPKDIERDGSGFVLTGGDVPEASWPLERRPFDLETSMPGVFAAGDVRHGSVKRVASAVGEGSIAVQMLHLLFADQQRTPRGRSAEQPSTIG
jgi:thioredoxin reductase (NADPH)